MACKAAEYAVPTVPPASEIVVSFKGCHVEVEVVEPAAIVSPSEAVAVCGVEEESVTVTPNDAVAAALGVPLITPAAESVNPAGKLPEVSFHEYGEVPPVACKDVE